MGDLKRNINGIHEPFNPFQFFENKLMMFDTNLAEDFEEVNNAEESFNSENPAFGMVIDGASLTAFYEFLLNKGVTSSGKQLLSEKNNSTIYKASCFWME